MKKVITGIIIFISLSGCSQSKEKKQNISSVKYNINNYILPESTDITEENFTKKITDQIKHYNHEPRYYFRINKQDCAIRVYVNDVNIFDDYKNTNYVTPIPIDQILSSGNQKVTIKMYPVNDENEKLEADETSHISKLSKESQVNISVICIDEKSAKGLDDEKKIIEVINPNEARGKEVYEFSFNFQAEVPYQFEGWTKGQDLRKLDQDLVKKKALEFYEMVGNIYTEKDLNARLKIDYPSTLRIQSSNFSTKQDIKEILNYYSETVSKRNYTIIHDKNFKMEYMGDGRLLRLITSNEHPNLRGNSMLLLQYDVNGNIGIHSPGITLYLPKDRNLDEGFMMWK